MNTLEQEGLGNNTFNKIACHLAVMENDIRSSLSNAQMTLYGLVEDINEGTLSSPVSVSIYEAIRSIRNADKEFDRIVSSSLQYIKALSEVANNE